MVLLARAMRVASLSAAAGLLWLAAAAAQDAGAAYKAPEKANLTLCATVSMYVKSIAEYKVAGMPEDRTDKYYGHAPGQRRNPLVHEVYTGTVTDAWEYAAGYFQDCAVSKAKIPVARVAPAAYCMRNAMIADTAISLRILGKAKADVYAYLARFGDDTARATIDGVYAAATAPKRNASLDTWNTCMGRWRPAAERPAT
jgi:hypothetical protein